MNTWRKNTRRQSWKTDDACSRNYPCSRFSAVLAYVNREVGWEVTADILTKTTNACRMHAVNWCEVWHIVRRTNDEVAVDALMGDLRTVGIGEESDIDPAFWREVARCQHSVRSAGETIALMDCFAVALANRRGVPVVTADHGEFDYVHSSGLCRVIFIRVSKTHPLSPADLLIATS